MQNSLTTRIPFHIPFVSGDEHGYIEEVFKRREFSGAGYFTQRSEQWLERFTLSDKILLTSSCTHALEMSAILCEIQPGDEVIMPSFNFVSAANAFALRGAKIVFVDIRPDTMNIDEALIEKAISKRTKAIVVVHYGGVACEMDTIMDLAIKNNLRVVEDAAHGIGAYFKGRHLGTIGHFGVISFHDSKNIHCGEGGALLINDREMAQKAEIIREKGTNRMAFFQKKVDKYSWVSLGSSYLASELNAAYLFGQLAHIERVNAFRLEVQAKYRECLESLERVELLLGPTSRLSNGHIFYIKCKDGDQRSLLQKFLAKEGIEAFFHYTPLHSSFAGRKYGRFVGTDKYTTTESSRLLRLPLFFGFSEWETVCTMIEKFYSL